MTEEQQFTTIEEIAQELRVKVSAVRLALAAMNAPLKKDPKDRRRFVYDKEEWPQKVKQWLDTH